MKDCCDSHKKKTLNTLIRAIIFIVLGVLLHIPFFEALLASGLIANIFFIGVSLLLFYSLQHDFDNKMGYSIGLVFAIGIALVAPSFVSPIFSIASLFLSIALCAVSLFTDFKNNKKSSQHSFFEFPSMEKIVLLFVILNWLISLFSLLPIFSALAYPFVLHDSLMVIGLFTIASWVRQSVQTNLIPHNFDGLTVNVRNDEGKFSPLQISSLKKGMIIRISEGTETMLPVRCTALGHCKIGKDSAEQRVSITNNSSIDANTTCYSGQVRCNEDFKKVTHDEQSKATESSDMLLSGIMVITLLIALTSGIWFGISAGSILIGLQTFCLNLIVTCPCVFLITKPIMNYKFLTWLKNGSKFNFNKMPSNGKPDIVVFDRTHTLYVPPSNCSDRQQYEMIPGAQDLIEDLKKMGIRCYILSGHSEGPLYVDNLNLCKKHFSKVIGEDNIIFDKKYNGKESQKDKFIAELQRYGCIKENRSAFEEFWSSVKNIFRPTVVGMVGDGINDIGAMKQADLSICVSKSESGAWSEVQKTANFCVDQENLPNFPDVIKALGDTNTVSKTFIFTSFAYNLILLSLVNGLYSFIFGCAFPSTMVCLASFAFCTVILTIASLWQMSYPIKNNAPGDREKCACCSGEFCCHESSENSRIHSPINDAFSSCSNTGDCRTVTGSFAS